MQSIIAREEPDLFITEWKDGQASCGIPISEVLNNSLTNVALVRGGTSVKFDRALIAVRGGPYAELAFQVGMGLHPTQLDVLHLALTGAANDAPFKGLKHILRHMPEVNLRSITTDDASHAIFEESQRYDIVVLGATAGKSASNPTVGPVAEKLLRKSSSTVMVVKSARPFRRPISMKVRGFRRSPSWWTSGLLRTPSTPTNSRA